MFEFTTEELLALAAGTGLSDPVYLLHTGVAEWPSEVRLEINRVGLRSLLARDLIRATDAGGLEAPELLAEMIRISSAPDLMVRYFVIDASAMGECTFLVDQRMTVGHRTTSVGNHSMTMMPTEHAASAIAEVCAVPERSAGTGADVLLTPGQIREIVAAAASPVPGDLESLARRAGLDESNMGVISALAREGSTGHVVQVVEFNASDRTVSGSSTTWADTGSSGLWLAEGATAEGDGEPTVELRPATRAEVVESILSGFPSWLDCRSAFAL